MDANSDENAFVRILKLTITWGRIQYQRCRQGTNEFITTKLILIKEYNHLLRPFFLDGENVIRIKSVFGDDQVLTISIGERLTNYKFINVCQNLHL